MQSGEDFILLVAPEGTRYRSKSWKTGFYYIAQEAGVLDCSFDPGLR